MLCRMLGGLMDTRNGRLPSTEGMERLKRTLSE